MTEEVLMSVVNQVPKANTYTHFRDKDSGESCFCHEDADGIQEVCTKDLGARLCGDCFLGCRDWEPVTQTGGVDTRRAPKQELSCTGADGESFHAVEELNGSTRSLFFTEVKQLQTIPKPSYGLHSWLPWCPMGREYMPRVRTDCRHQLISWVVTARLELSSRRGWLQ